MAARVDLGAAVPAVLLEFWRPVTFHADGSVELGAPRQGPAPSDTLFPPTSVRLTDRQLASLIAAVTS
jgi:hypothetical protein